MRIKNWILPALFLIIISFLGSCSRPLEWPDSPIYRFPAEGSTEYAESDILSVMQSITGRYAHYDVVAYEDQNTKTPMNTFTISYGITEYYISDGKLFQKDSFCRAEHKINQRGVESFFSDKAVQAIQPRIQEVELFFQDGHWNIYRPASPVLLSIKGDPSLPLSRNPEDPDIIDADGDGKPGVTVELKIGGFIKRELYIIRREIYSNYLVLQPDGSLIGHVQDESEQFVLGATMKILRQQSNSVQVDDPGLNPVILIPLEDEQTGCEAITANRISFFPPEPEFR